MAGNTNGIYIAAGARDNLIRENVAIGNPAIQSASTPGAQAFDILNLAPAGQTQFDRNFCVTAQNAPCPAVGTHPHHQQH